MSAVIIHIHLTVVHHIQHHVPRVNCIRRVLVRCETYNADKTFFRRFRRHPVNISAAAAAAGLLLLGGWMDGASPSRRVVRASDAVYLQEARAPVTDSIQRRGLVDTLT